MNHSIPIISQGDTCNLHMLRNDHVDKSLPKNFDKPLTCFFWHQAGRCNKRDIDCAYAHHDTGHYAAGPIHVASRMWVTLHQNNHCLLEISGW
jgi:hypothetical protein